MMNRFGICLVAGVLLAVSGCVFDSDDGDGGEEFPPGVRNGLGIGSVAAVYFPMVPGSAWQYEETRMTTYDGETATFTDTDTKACRSKFTIDGTTYLAVGIIEEGAFQDYMNYWYDGDDVYHISSVPIYKTVTAPHAAPDLPRRIAEPIHDRERDILEYRLHVPEGKTWTVLDERWTPDRDAIDTGMYDADDYIDTVIKRTYMGKQSVTTTAGTFDSCMKFKETSTERFRMPVYDAETQETFHETGTSESTSYLWLAPGIGLVRTEESSTFEYEGEYVSYTETQLVSYDIPDAAAAEPAVHSLTGKVVDRDGTGIAGVAVTVTGEGGTVSGTTGGDGVFAVDGLVQGYYEVTPSMTGMDILPAIATANIVESDTYVGTFLGEMATAIPAEPPFPAATYLQFHEGATWTYTETSYDDAGEPLGTREVSSTCTGEVMRDELAEPHIELVPTYADRGYYLIDGDDVYSYETGMGSLVLIAKPTATLARGGIDDAFDMETSDMLVYTFDKPAGTAWRIIEASSTRIGSNASICVAGRYAGLETVETAAGTFENCARFEFTTQTGYEADDEPQTGADMVYVSGSQTMILTRWFAPDVGLVKQTEVWFKDGDNRQDDGSYVFEPGSFRFETELELLEYSVE